MKKLLKCEREGILLVMVEEIQERMEAAIQAGVPAKEVVHAVEELAVNYG